MQEDQDNVWLSAGEGDMDRTLAFLASASSVDTQDEYGFTALMASCQYGRVQLVNVLLQKGADPNLKDKEGNTAVHHCDYPEVLRILIQVSPPGP